ncbi:hypothetical protein EYF80_006320 [Liparis tanakae]|uniref:Uncharacterized protein n=1 Tax=Liparis tanakae TaxID=230148 RepID=A0A4Z2IZB9_9TELE|nr:hypothetical protein EYF80_006320 [Liparis tanakae]
MDTQPTARRVSTSEGELLTFICIEIHATGCEDAWWTERSQCILGSDRWVSLRSRGLSAASLGAVRGAETGPEPQREQLMLHNGAIDKRAAAKERRTGREESASPPQTHKETKKELNSHVL